jgi:hypothetical protein
MLFVFRKTGRTCPFGSEIDCSIQVSVHNAYVFETMSYMYNSIVWIPDFWACHLRLAGSAYGKFGMLPHVTSCHVEVAR